MPGGQCPVPTGRSEHDDPRPSTKSDFLRPRLVAGQVKLHSLLKLRRRTFPRSREAVTTCFPGPTLCSSIILSTTQSHPISPTYQHSGVHGNSIPTHIRIGLSISNLESRPATPPLSTDTAFKLFARTRTKSLLPYTSQRGELRWLGRNFATSTRPAEPLSTSQPCCSLSLGGSFVTWPASELDCSGSAVEIQTVAVQAGLCTHLSGSVWRRYCGRVISAPYHFKRCALLGRLPIHHGSYVWRRVRWPAGLRNHYGGCE